MKSVVSNVFLVVERLLMGEFAVIRAVKHKFSSSVAGIGKHMNREIQTDNANKSQWSENQSWTPQHEFRTWAEAPPIRNFQASELARRIELLHEDCQDLHAYH